jgi:hypothetical protein
MHQGVRPPDFSVLSSVIRGPAAELDVMSTVVGRPGGSAWAKSVVTILGPPAGPCCHRHIGPNFFVINQPSAGLVGMIQYTYRILGSGDCGAYIDKSWKVRYDPVIEELPRQGLT